MQIIIDISTWTQTEKNYLMAAAYSLIWQQLGVDASDLTVSGGVINSTIVTQDVSAILTQTALKDWIAVELAAIEAARIAALPEIEARETELATSQFKDIKLAKVDEAIDNVNNLTELKALLKKFARYAIARN